MLWRARECHGRQANSVSGRIAFDPAACGYFYAVMSGKGWVHVDRFATTALAICARLPILCAQRSARAIDFDEIQIYPAETTPVRHLDFELQTNSVISATGAVAHRELEPYQIHATLEATYGLLPWLEVGQYVATARLDDGDYQYAGSRTKVHFSLPQTAKWPVSFGGNVELEYMRRVAEENPLVLEMRPIAQTHVGRFALIGNFAFSKPFSGPGTHDGVTFAPSGLLQYEKLLWGCRRQSSTTETWVLSATFTEPRRSSTFWCRHSTSKFWATWT